MRKKIISFISIIFFICNVGCKTYADEVSEDDLLDYDVKGIVQTSARTSEEDDLKIDSKIAVAYDRASGRVVWGKNEEQKTAMASTTKIMTAIVVIENSKMDDIVEISRKSAGTGGSRLGLKSGDKVSVKDLLYGLMLRSGNDAAVALAEHVGGSVENFSNMMNKKASSLLLYNTHFVTPHGLDDPLHYTTAIELSKITDYALKNEIFLKIVGTKNYSITINGTPRNISNTNELLGNYDGVYGVKTGFTNNAGRCLVTAIKKDDIDIITVVIQASDKKSRSADSVKIIKYIFKYYEKFNLEKCMHEKFESWCEANKDKINIVKAKKKEIQLYMDEPQNKEILVKSNKLDSIDVKINCMYSFEAPLCKGQKIGEVKFYYDGKLLEVNNICFSDNIYKKDFFDYVCECIRSIL